MRFVIFAAIIFLVSFMPQKKTRIVFFGDSITQEGAEKANGFIRKIDSMVKVENRSQNYELVGAGISGNKVYDLYFRMDSDVIMKNPDVVIIYIGVNDVWHKLGSGTGTDANRFELFYNGMLKKFKEKNIRCILCTPAVIGEKTDNTNQQDGDMNRYANIVRDIARKNNLPLIDLRNEFMNYNKANNPENKESGILTRDRVHLNERGNQLVAELMWKVIKGF
jgi:lysophospholipase L1-like esterase